LANQWLRLWHDMPTDPKWRTIAKLSRQRIGDVIAVYTHILVAASTATERGRTQSFNCEDVASALDLETPDVMAIVDAMQSRVLDGNRVAGWDKRQPAREDGSAERSRAWREEQKAKNEAPPKEGERTRTQAERTRTQDTEKDKEEEKKDPPASRGPRASRKCPEQFEVSDSLREWASANTPGADLGRETDAFRDHTFRASITDWDGAWRNWMRKAAERAPKARQADSVESFQQRAARERMQQMSPRLAAKAPGAQPFAEVIDGSTKLIA
jgi:hypothetical protein